MQKALVNIPSPREQLEKELRGYIVKRRKILMAIAAKVEMLKMDLDAVRQTYDVRIGRLYAYDNQLDLEIIRLKQMITKLAAGMSHEQATEEINNTFYGQEKEFAEEFARIREEEKELNARREANEEENKNIKKLFKKLLFAHHPDLVSDKIEKKRREALMKKINKAYAANDLFALQQIASVHHKGVIEETTIEQLEKSIQDIDQMIIGLSLEYKELKESRWALWKMRIEKAKKKNIDIFREMEDKILDDIVKKKIIIKKLEEDLSEKTNQ